MHLLLIHESIYNTNFLLDRFQAGDSELLDTCTFLDPRVKALVYLNADQKRMIKNHVCTTIEINYSDSDAVPVFDSSNIQSGSTTTTSASTTTSSLLGSILGDSYSTASEPSNSHPVEVEVDKYLAEVSCSMDTNPLTW